MGLLRLLASRAAMGEEDQMSQTKAWRLYGQILSFKSVSMLDEPLRIEPAFRARTQSRTPGTKEWASAYLSAFGPVEGLTLVTFDRTLSKRSQGSVLLAA